MAKHQHEPQAGFRFTTCRKCGAAATHQKTCKICGKDYCTECEARKK